MSATRQTPNTTSSLVLLKKARARVPVPGALRGRPAGASPFGTLDPRPTVVHCGPSPSASVSLRSPFSPLSTTSSRPSSFRFSATLTIFPFSARFVPCTPSAPPPSLLMRVAHYPQACGFALYSCRPLSLHGLLMTPSQFLTTGLAYHLTPIPPPPPPSLLGVVTITPGVVDAASDLVRGIPGTPVGVVPLLLEFWWLSVTLGNACFFSRCPLIVGSHSSALPIPPPPPETETTRHLPPARFELILSIVLNVPPARRVEARQVFLEVQSNVEPPFCQPEKDIV